jgi:hypothetical protein
MISSTKDLRPEKDCAGKDQKHIQKTDPSSSQRGRPQKKKKKTVTVKTIINIWSQAQYGCFIPRQTGRLIVGRKMRLRDSDSAEAS